ncbi:MAG: Crp/Fnr family transcriptional regulator [Bacteroidetes bacterium]|nr:Crp/Fnr family transcriptional regulator [Bacteroidota bacterium]
MLFNTTSCPSLNTKKNTCENCAKRDYSLLNELSYDELKILNKNRYIVSYKTGETICKEGTKPLGLICLNKGKVKIIRRSDNGTELIVALKKPVDFIGFRALMSDNIYLSSIIALEEVEVCIIDKTDFFKVIEANKQLAFKIINLFAQELNELDNRMFNNIHKHIRARMADALLLIDEVYGTYPNGTLAVLLKRQDLAALSNMTASNVSRVLSSFSKENLIETNQRDIKIKNLKALKDLSVFG